MNKTLWLLSLGIMSFAVFAQSNQPNTPNSYVTNTQQLIEASSAQAKENLYKAYPPPVSTPLATSKSGPAPSTQDVTPPVSNTQPVQNQISTNSDQQPTADQQAPPQQTGYQENVAVPNGNTTQTTTTPNQQSPNMYGGGSGSGATSGSDSSSSNSSNMYR